MQNAKLGGHLIRRLRRHLPQRGRLITPLPLTSSLTRRAGACSRRGQTQVCVCSEVGKKGSTSSVVYDATFPKGEGLSRPYLLLLPSYLLFTSSFAHKAQPCTGMQKPHADGFRKLFLKKVYQRLHDGGKPWYNGGNEGRSKGEASGW